MVAMVVVCGDMLATPTSILRLLNQYVLLDNTCNVNMMVVCGDEFATPTIGYVWLYN